MKCFWGSFASSLSILCLLYLFFSSSSFQAASAGQAGGGSSVADYLTEDLFEAILKNRNDPICPARGFYTYESFLEAAKNFSDFGTTGDQETRKREIAAFFGLTSYLTSAPGWWWRGQRGSDEYSWGYCIAEDPYPGSYDYCEPLATNYPCVPGQKYYGRGPVKLSWSFHYGQVGEGIGYDILSKADLVAEDPVISFKTALWIWMTPRGCGTGAPSPHEIMTGKWTPSYIDVNAGRSPGYGAVTNIVTDSSICGRGWDPKDENAVRYYERVSSIFGVDAGKNLDCNYQLAFGECLSKATNISSM